MELLLLTSDPNPEAVLPALALLAHSVRPAPTEVSSLLEASSADVALVDARTDLAAARGLCRLLGSTGSAVPVVAVLTEGGLVAVNADWGLDDILLPGTGPAEVDARLRLLVARSGGVASPEASGKITLGELVSRYADPFSEKAFEKEDYRMFLLNTHLEKTSTKVVE